MFEKEAEKRLPQAKIDYYNSFQCKPNEVPAIEIVRFGSGYTKGFKDGAEFGYNKANEWHYVKDGDLPKAYQKCYFIYSNVYGKDGKISFSKTDINVLTGIYAFFLDKETGEETTEPCFYDDINDDEIGLKEVYAWKEIVLPKESE